MNGQIIALAQHLCLSIALIEFGHESLSNLGWIYITVEYASVHTEVDYNRFANSGKWLLVLFTKDTPHKLHLLQKNCKLVFWITLTAGITALWFFGLAQVPAAAQQLGSITPTATGTGANAYVSASSIEGFANVRSGPNSFDYPLVGTLLNGETAPAIGRSPAGEWIEIIFPAAPRGTGWVYVAYVTLSPPGTLLPIVEPPPTPAPLETPTLNPTFVAAFQTLATSTRLPTFTAPPPLAIPTFINRSNNVTGRDIATLVVLGLGLLGLLGLAVTSFRRR